MRIAIFNDISRVRLLELLPDFQEVNLKENPDAILLRSENLNTKTDLLPHSLSAICRAGSGVHNIPLDWCNEHGVAVFNTPAANANAVAELVHCALIVSTRNLGEALRYMRENAGKGVDWEKLKSRFRGNEIRGKRILVVGLGAIGLLVAQACKKSGMLVDCYDPYAPAEKFSEFTRIKTLDTKLPYDYITLHMTLTDETRHLVNATFLNRMKRGVILLNFVRAEAVEQDAIRIALREKTIQTYVSDFVDEELLSEFDEKDVIFLPHLGASTQEAEENALIMSAEQLHEFWCKGVVTNSVNFPTLKTDAPYYPRLAISNKDILGIIAQYTAIIRDASLNIKSQIHHSKGKIAYGIVDISPANTDLSHIAKKIREIDGVTGVRVVY